MAITTVPVRAKINFGGLTTETPFVLSFNVKKERNSKSTFNASVKVLSTDLNSITGSNITISAGKKGNIHKIFTGDILQSNPSPCWEDPKYVILNISGADISHRLENEKYTRLQEFAASKWALITGVNRKAKKGAQFRLVNHPVIEPTDGESTNDNQNNYNDYQVSDLEQAAKVPERTTVSPISIKLGPVKMTSTV